MQEKKYEIDPDYITFTTLKELSYLYNKTGYFQDNKIVGSITDGGADLISFFGKNFNKEQNKKKLERINVIRYTIWIDYCNMTYFSIKDKLMQGINNFGKINDKKKSRYLMSSQRLVEPLELWICVRKFITKELFATLFKDIYFFVKLPHFFDLHPFCSKACFIHSLY